MILPLISLIFSATCTDTIRTYALPSSVVEVMGYTLEASTLADVRRTLGKAKLRRSGDASESLARIHYYNTATKTFITFSSDEMGGGESITSISLSRSTEEDFLPIKKHLNPTDFLGLRIGQSKNEVEKCLQAKITCDSVILENTRALKIRNESFTEIKTLALRFQGGKLAEVSIVQGTSN